MSDTLPCTVIVVVDQPGQEASLMLTLQTLDWSREVLIAHSTPLQAVTPPEGISVQFFPMLDLPASIIQLRCAKVAAFEWILFLIPGDEVTYEVIADLGRIIQHADAEGQPWVFQFPRRVEWEDVSWPVLPLAAQIDFVQKGPFLEAMASCRPIPVQRREGMLEHQVAADNLMPWLARHARGTAEAALVQEGLSQVKKRLHQDWFKSVLKLGVTEGILRGSLFRTHPERMGLLIRIIRLHFHWLWLYRFFKKTAL